MIKAGFFLLGVPTIKFPCPPSLNFWRSLAQAFIEKLKKYPEIEMDRHKVKITFPAEEFDSFINAAPLMVGREYLDRDILSSIWKELNQLFLKKIQLFPGSVKRFFHEFSPHIHLAGRVYFHLVENKDENFPFQFLATYATKSGDSIKHRPL